MRQSRNRLLAWLGEAVLLWIDGGWVGVLGRTLPARRPSFRVSERSEEVVRRPSAEEGILFAAPSGRY